MPLWIEVCKVSEFDRENVKTILYEDVPIAVFKIGNDFYAIVDECTHMEARLSEGNIEGEVITCPLHGAKFNLRTGDVLSLPAASPIQVLPVKIENEIIFVDVEDI